jgi:hypothetical protein
MQNLSVINLLRKREGSEIEIKVEKITKDNIDIEQLRPHGLNFVTQVLNLIKINRLNDTDLSHNENHEYMPISDNQKKDLILEVFVGRHQNNILDQASYPQLINFIKILRR